MAKPLGRSGPMGMGFGLHDCYISGLGFRVQAGSSVLRGIYRNYWEAHCLSRAFAKSPLKLPKP